MEARSMRKATFVPSGDTTGLLKSATSNRSRGSTAWAWVTYESPLTSTRIASKILMPSPMLGQGDAQKTPHRRIVGRVVRSIGQRGNRVQRRCAVEEVSGGKFERHA